MLSLTNQHAKLSNVNLRAELHGEETKVAVDLKIEIKVSNDILSEFAPDLKSSLYRKDPDAAQGQLIDDPNHLPSLKYPQMSPIKWDWSGAGYETVINYGISGKDDIVMLMTEVDTFRFECCDGGTVEIGFRITGHPTQEEIGRLSGLVQREISLTLVPPSADDQLK